MIDLDDLEAKARATLKAGAKRIVDPAAILDLVAEVRRSRWSRTARTFDEWHEDDGNVVWWRLPIEEPPYVGTPLDDDFPDGVTHWTPLELPLNVPHDEAWSREPEPDGE